jgi:hypothetical protein
MSGSIHKEENNVYQFDFRKALWSIDKLHNSLT